MQQASVCPSTPTRLRQPRGQWGEPFTAQIRSGRVRTVLPTRPPRGSHWVLCAPGIKTKRGSSCQTSHTRPPPASPACTLHTHTHMHTPALRFRSRPVPSVARVPVSSTDCVLCLRSWTWQRDGRASSLPPQLLSRGKQNFLPASRPDAWPGGDGGLRVWGHRAPPSAKLPERMPKASLPPFRILGLKTMPKICPHGVLEAVASEQSRLGHREARAGPGGLDAASPGLRAPRECQLIRELADLH